MAGSYTKDLALEVAYKLNTNNVYKLSLISTEWSNLLTPDFWLFKFIKDFSSNLPNRADYEQEYVVMEYLSLEDLYSYIVKKEYLKLIVYMLKIWKTEYNPCIIAARVGNIDIMRLLISDGADINVWSDEPFITAAMYDKLEMLEFLLANGANINAQDDLALIWATSIRSLRIIKFLIANGANIHTGRDKPLISAIYDGDLDIVSFLIANGADIHARGDEALIWGVHNHKPEVIEFLLDHGADITVLSNKAKEHKWLKDLLIKYDKTMLKGIKL